MNSPK
jgi:sensor domain CHASE-containing protein